MAEFKKHSFKSNHRPFNKGGGRPGGRDQEREMFEAECNSCHKSCQVPFQPNGKKPVYCRDCFRQDDDRPQRFEKKQFGPQRSFDAAPRPENREYKDLKRQLDLIEATLEKLVTVIETANRATALKAEVRKYIPADKPAKAPAKTPTKAPTKIAKKAAKPSAKKASKKA